MSTSQIVQDIQDRLKTEQMIESMPMSETEKLFYQETNISLIKTMHNRSISQAKLYHILKWLHDNHYFDNDVYRLNWAKQWIEKYQQYGSWTELQELRAHETIEETLTD